MRTLLLGFGVMFAPLAWAADKDAWYTKAVKSVEAKIEPAEAKPGSVVTLKLTVELNPGYHTYPLQQRDPQAMDMVNKLTLSNEHGLIFVGEAIDPSSPKLKAEPLLGIKEMSVYVGKAEYRRLAVVSPKAKPGELKVTISEFRLSICDQDNCFPPKKLSPVATLKVLDGPAVPVDAKYAAEVEKALKGN